MKRNTSDKTDVPDKFYFKIGEVSRIVDVPSSVLRYWETEFSQIKPKRTEAGQRLYRRQDVLVVLRIKDLLYDEKFTIDGARQYLKKKQSGAIPSSDRVFGTKEIKVELMKIRAFIDAHLR